VAVAAVLGAELVSMGSAGAEAMAVLRGEAHGYLHAGGQFEWDSAAPAGAAGLHVSQIDGSPLRYNRADPLLPDLLVCWPDVAGLLLARSSANSRPADTSYFRCLESESIRKTAQCWYDRR
jgi:3'(2'), 5'-bisphosphate nucleotidase